MNKKGFRVSAEVYDSDHYDRFRMYFEGMDEYGIDNALLFTPEMAYLLIEPGVKVTNLDTGLIEELPGGHYRKAYIDGFNKGVAEFQKNWSISPDVKYGPEYSRYRDDLRRAYEGSMTGETAEELVNGRNDPGWLHELNRRLFLVTEKSVHKQGYYAGLVAKYRELDAGLVSKYREHEAKQNQLPIKPEPNKRHKLKVTTLEDACSGDGYEIIKDMFIQKGYCDASPFRYRSERYPLYVLAGILKELHKTRLSKKLTHKEIMAISENSFSAEMRIDTVKRAAKILLT